MLGQGHTARIAPKGGEMKDLEIKVIEAALTWRNYWPDTKDEIEANDGCNCKMCQLIRACDEYTLNS